MDPTAVTKWLDNVMGASNVTGALLIDSQTGLCLGARGKATEDDATYITVASRAALDTKGVGAVAYKDSKVILRKGGSGVLVAVYKEKDLGESPDEM
ncbi:hypothetical protein B9Z19DRAFT_1091091 [Tuber borchii]|uniref:Uncharacterized protein n=1 Tax=Tuber borchii TaxID=42251 RepID=A0A2T6ZI30_TUBBO|nr:hypothetical protein B9Z19DRAFT_1091091 [Tuber borchii]